jgi:tryptophan synthase alpha chain
MMFVPYVCCGDPSIEFTKELIKTLASYSDMIELGIPFSDPIADGKTIQAAAARALGNGVTVEQIFRMVEQLRSDGIKVPFVFMTYFNIVYAHRPEDFLKRMKNAGIQGIIIPDLPFGEEPEFEKLAKEHGISIINLIAPNTPEERAKSILEQEGMFTYLVSVSGVTGSRDKVSQDSIEFVKRIRRLAGPEKKLCVGFGISGREQADTFAEVGADGIIVGSRIIDVYSVFIEGDGIIEKGSVLSKVEAFAKQMRG